jgi:hypothetical protein
MLKTNIVATIDGLKCLDVGEAADLIAEVADEMAEDDAEDIFNGAILDGIRWGYAAAVSVELGGGAMLRVVLPGGVGITHEWAHEKDAQHQVKAVLDHLLLAPVTAHGTDPVMIEREIAKADALNDQHRQRGGYKGGV